MRPHAYEAPSLIRISQGIGGIQRGALVQVGPVSPRPRASPLIAFGLQSTSSLRRVGIEGVDVDAKAEDLHGLHYIDLRGCNTGI